MYWLMILLSCENWKLLWIRFSGSYWMSKLYCSNISSYCLLQSYLDSNFCLYKFFFENYEFKLYLDFGLRVWKLFEFYLFSFNILLVIRSNPWLKICFYDCDINKEGNLIVFRGKGRELSDCSRKFPGC